MLPNKAEFKYEELIAIFGEDAVNNFNEDFQSTGVSTDTRDIAEGNIFVALPGENSDGHTRIEEAINKGASAIVCEADKAGQYDAVMRSIPYIAVNDTLDALGELAKYHRGRFSYPVVAIGGANGKTTTKDITVHLLSQKYKVLGTYKNFNNRIGVPLMLLQMNDEYNCAVLEIGTNEPGEIAILSDITDPTDGLITNIGREHLEKLINLDGVELEETFLFGKLHKTGGNSYINLNDKRLKKYTAIIEKKVGFGLREGLSKEGDSDLIPKEVFTPDIAGDMKLNEDLQPLLTLEFEGRKIEAQMQAAGYIFGINALGASAIAFKLGLSDEEIKQGLESYLPDSSNDYGRMLIEKKGNLAIINDCYNANPESMLKALDTLAEYNNKGKTIAVLADMLELGDASEEEHINIIKYAAGKAGNVFLAGPEMQKDLEKCEEATALNTTHFTDREELKNKLSELLSDCAAILIKGSRGMKMEEFVNFVKEK